jgi:tetratricopeptide (TPR) repeat protein
MRAGSFGSVAPSRAFSGGEFSHGSFAGQAGGFAGRGFGGREFGNDFNRGFNRFGAYGGYGGWGWGGWWPWWGLGGDWGDWGYPYNYGYDYPYLGDYNYTYAPTDYGSADTLVTVPEQIPSLSETSPMISAGGQQVSDEALQYYSEARTAFMEGDYQKALRLAEHAGVDTPANSKVHELISLALFALGKYGPAASEAHAAMALGSIADWKDLYGYYNNVDKYTSQLRALEKAARDNPKDGADHFLAGYHYLMIGARNEAKAEFADVVKLTPKDKLASHYLQQLQSNAPLTPPQMATRPQSKAM